MNQDFSQPQRQSVTGIIIMTGNMLQQIIRALIVPIALMVFKTDYKQMLYFVILVGAILVISLVFGYLSYRRFTFFLDEAKQEFVINKGIFKRTQLTIQLDKIQQVNINQSLLQKVIGIYSLHIDTAGTESKEVGIKAIDEQSAYHLKEKLLNHKPSVHPHETEELATPAPAVPLLKISAGTLFKVGLTSNYGRSLALLIGFAFAAFHNIKELLKAFDTDNGQVENVLEKGITAFSVSLLIVLVLFILLATNIIRTFVKYFDFQISKQNGSLLIASGLFSRNHTLLSPKKVQITAYSQNYFQKKFNFMNLTLRQAHAGKEQSEKELHKSNLEVPGCNLAEKEALLQLILGKTPPQGQLFIPNFRFLNLPIFFNLVIPVGIYLLLASNMPQLWPFYPLAIAYFVVGLLMIYISYTKHRLRVSEDFIVKQKGIWDISNEIVFSHKIQSITTFQFPWHKSVDVGHLHLHTAAGIIRFKYGNYTEIKQLVNYWLYQLESGSEEWM
ncbi:PH domain-containing protein [Pedobacter sp. KR3-3]|uniref:PH domain-containing protein n=1 Tax=Pedobacter albus TaxID=3113905 RepID=A0ABU7I2I5_9SPHI|nr:PH domain-containing protein [Pedobacter sp. KR3-3]MEE1943679.1 PH domain-containing protein [Pedobacter sp. KR3-3]